MKYETKEIIYLVTLIALSMLIPVLVAVSLDQNNRIEWLENKNDYYWDLKEQADSKNQVLIDSNNNLHDLIESQGWGTVRKTELGTVIIIEKKD